LDWIVYSIFRWWWNPILRNDPRLAKGFYDLYGDWMIKNVKIYEGTELLEEMDRVIANNEKL
jgi:hypothetical protein